MKKRVFYILLGFPLMLLLFAGCAKEYSYEGGPVVNPTDTTKPAFAKPWICPGCIGKDTYIESRWSFHNDSSFNCGIIDTAIVSPERTGFTFFGPSSCSLDSGMVITVYLESAVLNSDLHNITTNKVAFYYYDNVGQTFTLITQQGTPFSFTIESYIHQTRIATGTFSGFVFRANGMITNLSSGKFKVKLI